MVLNLARRVYRSLRAGFQKPLVFVRVLDFADPSVGTLLGSVILIEAACTRGPVSNTIKTQVRQNMIKHASSALSDHVMMM